MVKRLWAEGLSLEVSTLWTHGGAPVSMPVMN